MSKQGDSREAQGYTCPAPNCSKCQHLRWSVRLPTWMAKCNAESEQAGKEPPYEIKRHGERRSHHCGLGGFAVKLTAVCNDFKVGEGREV